MWRSIASSLTIVLSFLLPEEVSADNRQLQAPGDPIDGYEYYGAGWCDNSDGFFDYLRFDGVDTVAGCEAKCVKNSEFVGFTHQYDVDEDDMGHFCFCHYEDGGLPSGAGEDFVVDVFDTTGRVSEVFAPSFVATYTFSCYSYGITVGF